MKTYLTVAILMSFSTLMAGTIDRKAVVERHNIQTTDVNPILALGNGRFCFGVDGTGLQTFGGNIMTHWAWHSFPLPEGATMADVPETGTIETGRLVGEMKQASAKPEVSSWMFQNPHGFNLGRLRLTDAAGKVITVEQLANPTRTLDLWKGVQTAEYTFNGHPVKVQTTVHPDFDQVAVRIESELIGTGELAVELEFPYPVGSVSWKWSDPLSGFEKTKTASVENWQKYWMSGGAIDLSESRDPRRKELERRVVLSQYLMGTQSAGTWPITVSGIVGITPQKRWAATKPSFR